MNSIIDILKDLRIQFVTSETSRSIRSGWIGIPGSCPFCGHGEDGYLAIPEDGWIFSCWSCGIHSVKNVLSHLGVGYDRLKPFLDFVTDRNGYGPNQHRTKPRGKYTPPAELVGLGSAHLNYLRSRMIDTDMAQDVWEVSGIGISSRLPWRIFIPVTYRGTHVSWTTRAIGNVSHGKRYRSADPHEESIPIHDLLYGHDLARWSVIVVEGSMDAMRIGPGAVALMGVRASPSQIAKLAAFPTRAICFDGEPAAQRRARKLADVLAPLPGLTEVVELESGPDPGSANAAEITELRKRYLG